jgi:BASS family bile acid:Na+ symporter
MQQISIAALVVVMMLAIGLRTHPREFVTVGRRPGALLAMLFVNVVVVPALVLTLTSALALPAEITVGLLICAAAPGGPTGPLFAAEARGHLATAVIAMVSLSMLSVVTAPAALALSLGIGTMLDSDAILALVWPMMGTLGGFQLLPLLVGMALQRVRPQLADRLAMPASRIANVLLLVIIVGLLVTKGQVLADVGVVAIVLAAALVPTIMALGFAVPGPSTQRRSFAMVTGVRNISLALLLGAAYFPAPLTDATILTFGLFCMLLPFVIARVVGRGAAAGDAAA